MRRGRVLDTDEIAADRFQYALRQGQVAQLVEVATGVDVDGAALGLEDPRQVGEAHAGGDELAALLLEKRITLLGAGTVGVVVLERFPALVAAERLAVGDVLVGLCLLYTSPSPRDQRGSRMPSSA